MRNWMLAVLLVILMAPVPVKAAAAPAISGADVVGAVTAYLSELIEHVFAGKDDEEAEGLFPPGWTPNGASVETADADSTTGNYSPQLDSPDDIPPVNQFPPGWTPNG